MKRFIGGAVLALTMATSSLHGQGSEGFDVKPNCRVNVTVSGPTIPSDAIQVMVDNGAIVQIDRNSPNLYVVSTKKWSLFEDDPRWGTVTDFEVECNTIFLPAVVAK